MTRALITGVNGFVGHHLARELKSQDCQPIGLGQENEVSTQLSRDVTEYYGCDLTNEESVKTLDFTAIDSIIHLAGLAAVGPSFDHPARYINLNTVMLINIAEQCLAQHAKPRIIVVSTGAVYDSAQPLPLTEDSKVTFQSPYAVSKIAVENLAAYYRGRGLDVVVVRPFNHIGPGQIEGFLLPDLYANLIKTRGNGGPLWVGNLTTKRDYTDVRDVVRAYVALVRKDSLNENVYNICSGKSVSGEEILDILKKKLSLEHLETVVDEQLFRPSDAPDLFGDHTRLSQEIHWEPSITLEQTITDFIHGKQHELEKN